MLALVLGALWRTVRARLVRGPARPRWSLRFELVARALKLNAEHLARLPIPARRARTEAQARADASQVAELGRRVPATVGGVSGEWFLPRPASAADGPPDRTILYLHGGGFVMGSPGTHARLIMTLARYTHARVFAPRYRLGPEHTHPAALEDAVRAYEGLLAEGVPPVALALAGDSAGGNLVLTTLLRLRDAWRPLPACGVLLSPWVDVADRDGSMRAHEPYDWGTPADFDGWQAAYFARADPRDPLVSPLHAELAGLPPLLVQVGTREMLLDQVRRLGDRLCAAGVPVVLDELAEQVHDAHLLVGRFPELERLYAQIAAFVRTHSSPG